MKEEALTLNLLVGMSIFSVPIEMQTTESDIVSLYFILRKGHMSLFCAIFTEVKRLKSASIRMKFFSFLRLDILRQKLSFSPFHLWYIPQFPTKYLNIFLLFFRNLRAYIKKILHKKHSFNTTKWQRELKQKNNRFSRRHWSYQL